MPHFCNHFMGVNMDASIQSWQNSDSLAWPSQQPIPINHPLVPNEVRNAVSSTAKTNQLYRVVTPSVVEWWLLDVDGELVNIFWQAGKTTIRCNSRRAWYKI